MKESAQAALTWVRGHVADVAPGLADDWFETHDVHVHVPAGRDARRTARARASRWPPRCAR